MRADSSASVALRTSRCLQRTPTMDKPVHPFRIANFRSYWLSRFSGTIAVSAMSIVIGWQVYNLARETMDVRQAAFMLGMIGFAQFVPLFLLTPITGLVADSVDRRWIVRATTGLLVLTAASLWFLTWSGHLTLGRCSPPRSLSALRVPFRDRPIPRSPPIWCRGKACPPPSRSARSRGRSAPSPGPASAGCSMRSIPIRVWRRDAAVRGRARLHFHHRPGAAAARPDRPPAARPDRRGFSYVRRNRLVQAAITLDLFAVLLAGRPRCCRSMRATSCMSGRRGWACWRRAWGSARPRPRSGSRSTR